MPEATGLELTSGARSELGAAALQLVLDFFDQARELPVYPAVEPARLHTQARAALPETGMPAGELLQEFRTLVLPHIRHHGHPRMFGYVASSGTFPGAVGDLLASAINQNVTSWRSAPIATEIEQVVIDWIKEMIGYPQEALGLLLSGGSMANFTALATALRAKCTIDSSIDINEDGLRALPQPPVIYASELVHLSIPKAAQLLGLGRKAVRLIPVRADFTIDLAQLEAAIEADLAQGKLPICVVANAGDVNTGAFDPLAELSQLCRRYQLWLHVDGAYGGFAALAPSARPLFAAIATADSVSLDPHKWLFMPVDAGCLLVRDRDALRRAFAQQAEYIKVLDQSMAEAAISNFAFWDYGPELSRRFRALKIWLSLKYYGIDAFRSAIEQNIQLARQLGRLVEAAPDFELLAPVGLSIVCFRYLPEHLRRDLTAGEAEVRERAQAQLNQLNSEITARVQRSGQAYISNAQLHGQFALRACIVNFRTTEADLSELLEIIRQVARQ